jgi:hypothetical protein
VLALQALCAIFAVMPLSHILSERLFNVLATYAEMHEPDVRLGCSALRCFNEIHQQSLVPRDFSGYVVQAFLMTNQLLGKVLENVVSGEALESAVNEQYLDVFVEYLRVFMAAYLKRVLPDTSLPHSELFQQAYTLTISLSEPELFLHMAHLLADCVEVFATDESGLLAAALQQVRPVLVEMAKDVCNRTQAGALAFVDSLDDEDDEDDEGDGGASGSEDDGGASLGQGGKQSRPGHAPGDASPFRQHVCACAELASGIAALFPHDVVPPALELYEGLCRGFAEACPALLRPNPASGGAEASGEAAEARLVALARNLTAAANIAARLGYLAVAVFDGQSGLVPTLIEHTCAALNLLTEPGVVMAADCLGRLGQQLMAVLESLLQSIMTLLDKGGEAAAKELTQATLQCCSRGLQLYRDAPRLSHASAQLLFTMALSYRRSQVFESFEYVSQCLEFVLADGADGGKDLATPVAGAYVGMLYFTWTDQAPEQQQWDMRRQHLQTLMNFCQQGLSDPKNPGQGVGSCWR